MIRLSKIFRFEMAHAINGYNGSCRNIHGHSYILHVTAASADEHEKYIAAPGFILDFKELKKLVYEAVIDELDHKVLLSRDFISANPALASQENLVTWNAEPTAENMLIFIREKLTEAFPPGIKLVQLKLFETEDSYAEWMNDKVPQCY